MVRQNHENESSPGVVVPLLFIAKHGKKSFLQVIPTLTHYPGIVSYVPFGSIYIYIDGIYFDIQSDIPSAQRRSRKFSVKKSRDPRQVGFRNLFKNKKNTLF
jgi:hypothetical protein